MRRILELEQRIRRLETRRVLPSSSLDAGQLQSGNYVADETGWALFPELAEFGTIKLRNGIIGNDALTSPVSPAWIASFENNPVITPSEDGFAGIDVAVPDGFTRALVLVVGTVSAYNSTAGPDVLWAAVRVNETSSAPMFTEAETGRYTSITAATSYLNVPTALGGSEDLGATIHVELRLNTTAGTWDPSGFAARAELSGVALFLR